MKFSLTLRKCICRLKNEVLSVSSCYKKWNISSSGTLSLKNDSSFDFALLTWHILT